MHTFSSKAVRARRHLTLCYKTLSLAVVVSWGVGGCGTALDETRCTSSSDCAEGSSCVEGRCAPAPQAQREDERPSSGGGDGRSDSAEPEATAEPASAADAGTGDCGESACPALRIMCGQVVDDCGNLVDCGSCPAGEECLGTQCCRRRMCGDDDTQCGRADDRCGGVLDCGETCAPNERCQRNQCVPAPVELRRFQQRATFTTARNSGDANAAPWRELGDGTQRNGRGAKVFFAGPPSTNGRCTGSRLTRSDRIRLFAAKRNGTRLRIPADAIVTGVGFIVRAKHNGERPILRTLELYGLGGDLSADPWSGSLSLSAAYRDYPVEGGRSRLWGLSSDQLTPSVINRNDFGIQLSFERRLNCGESSQPLIDVVDVVVAYDLLAPI